MNSGFWERRKMSDELLAKRSNIVLTTVSRLASLVTEYVVETQDG